MMAAWRLISVEVLPEMRLRVRFVDGTAGEVQMQAFLQAPEVVGTMFEPLRDPGFLAQAAVVSGAVQWPNGADLAPTRCTMPFARTGRGPCNEAVLIALGSAGKAE